jgi:hypothetical protein
MKRHGIISESEQPHNGQMYGNSTRLDLAPFGMGAFSKLRDNQRLELHAVYLFTTEGFTAPPNLLLSVIRRRRQRARQRSLGLSIFARLLQNARSRSSSVFDCLVHLRPALRGFKSPLAYKQALEPVSGSEHVPIIDPDSIIHTQAGGVSSCIHHYSVFLRGT